MNPDTADVALVGPLPAPIGGVSTHVSRLARFLTSHGLVVEVIDCYPAPNKDVPPGVRYHGVPAASSRLLWLVRTLMATRARIVHLHFSQISSWGWMLGLIPLATNRKVVITFHHGEQEDSFRRLPVWKRVVTRFALRRFHNVVALSSVQSDFFKSARLAKADRVLLWRFDLPASVTEDASIPPQISAVVSAERGGEESILLASGYPSRFYRYEACLVLLDQARLRYPTRLVVVLYGSGTDSTYENWLRRTLANHPFVTVLAPMPPAHFHALLRRSSVYLRPSTVDSYGIAVSDALDAGTPCVASNVCERDPRANLFPKDDLGAFYRTCLEILDQGRLQKGSKAAGAPAYRRGAKILETYERLLERKLRWTPREEHDRTPAITRVE